eukprot:c11408_g1_i2.p1 GENE.c11408_g1_i2~~c11408_g1_i2.p1  ORF type:complete len:738 (+),score=182.38 c11408_g1_i2:109-2322(+)
MGDGEQDSHVLDLVLNLARSKLENSTNPHDNPKTTARKIIKVLQDEYSLSTAVKIDDLIDGKHEEISKASSLIAITTQRAASLFALELNLLTNSKLNLENHIKSTEHYLVVNKYTGPTFHLYFIGPLQKELDALKMRLADAESRQQKAQERFQSLRETATSPIMVELQKGTAEYKSVFASIAKEDLTEFCDAVGQLSDKAVNDRASQVRQVVASATDINPTEIEYVQKLFAEAKAAQPKMQDILNHIQESCKANNIPVRVEMGDLKSVERSMEKTVEEYDNDFSRLLDITRGSIECHTIKDATEAVKILSTMCELVDSDLRVEIVRVKNRLDEKFPAAAESGGYRDLLINIRLTSGHICELQIHLESFIALKKGGGHKIYSIARSLHLLDSEMSQVRVSEQELSTIDHSTVRDTLQSAFDRVAKGSCQALFLNQVQLSLAECSAMREALLSPACSLKGLYVPNCGIDATTSAAISEGVSKFGAFQHVDLSANEGFCAETAAAFVSEELEKYSVEEDKIDEGGMMIIVDALAEHCPQRMKDLRVDRNTITERVALRLAESLKHMASLEILYLGSTLGAQYGVAGAEALSQAMKHMTSLTDLGFEDSGLGPSEAKLFAAAIGNMPHLTALYIWNNQFGSEGASHLSQALKDKVHMRTFELGGNAMGSEGMRDMATALANMTQLTHLEMSSESRSHPHSRAVIYFSFDCVNTCPHGDQMHLVADSPVSYEYVYVKIFFFS